MSRIVDLDPDIRAADHDREATTSVLRQHAAAGRLDPDELGERVGAALGARTVGDLERLTEDLPVLRERAKDGRKESGDFRSHLLTYVTVILLLVAIWALTGAEYFWPMWPALGWGIGVAAHGLCAD